MEPVTATMLDAAERRWEARGSTSYHLVVRVRAPRFEPAVYDLVVQSGEVVTVERNGRPVASGSVDRYDYSMSGLFALLRNDLRLAAVPAIGDTPPVDLRARFEPETGRLVHYRRTVGTARRRVLLVEVLAYEPLARWCDGGVPEVDGRCPAGTRPADNVDLLPASGGSIEFVEDNPGSWIYHCHVVDHVVDGMFAFYDAEP
jgi:hypothetical protein